MGKDINMLHEIEHIFPDNWAITKVGDIAHLVTKGSTPTSYGFNFLGEGINFIKVENLFNGGINRSSIKNFIGDEAHNFLKRSQLVENDILYTIAGTIGRVATVNKNDLPANINQAIAVIRIPNEDIDLKYLACFLQSKICADSVVNRLRGIGMNNVSLEDVKNIVIPFPPLPEQHRIVAKIEELSSDLDAGVEALKKAKAQLKLYRQSVLKAAFAGRLTATWREANKDELIASSVALAGIRAEKAAEKKRRLPKTEPLLNTSGLPELPETWSWALLPELGELNRGKSKHRPRNDPKLFGGDYPFIQTGDIRKFEIIKEYSQTYNDIGLKQSRLWPENTLCITIAANIAETAILGLEACFPDSVVGFIADERICRVKYIHYFIKTAKQELEYYAPATAQKNINLETLYGVMVPLPSVIEQEEIIREIDRHYSLADAAEATLEMSFGQSERLRQSILKQAFMGRLVPQDPEDEPAAALLERIKVQKPVNATKKKPGRKTTQRELNYG